jgi:hypothetical protein
MLPKTSRIILWILIVANLILVAAQGWSGNWSVFYLLWPGYHPGAAFVNFVAGLAEYHSKMGFAIGVISVIILVFAFLAKKNIFVRIFGVLGLAVTVLAVLGGVIYVDSAFQDRLSLGQMADSSIGVFAAYFLMLLFTFWTPRFSSSRRQQT